MDIFCDQNKTQVFFIKVDQSFFFAVVSVTLSLQLATSTEKRMTWTTVSRTRLVVFTVRLLLRLDEIE